MKEIGMGKLVMLLDIYEEEVVGVHSVGEHITEKDEAWIISKKFGFIEWLVENDKIDRDRVDDSYENKFFGYTNYQILLMLLSISDTPIDLLCSILK